VWSKHRRHRDTGPLSKRGKPVPLSSLNVGERGHVVSFLGGRGLLAKMSALGFTPGAEITVIQNFGRGSIIVLARGTRIALGRGEAMHVLVHREPQ